MKNNDNSNDYIQLDESLPNENNDSSPLSMTTRALLQGKKS